MDKLRNLSLRDGSVRLALVMCVGLLGAITGIVCESAITGEHINGPIIANAILFSPLTLTVGGAMPPWARGNTWLVFALFGLASVPLLLIVSGVAFVKHRPTFYLVQFIATMILYIGASVKFDGVMSA